MMQQIGVVGGTFNPIHYGHLMVAEFAAQQFELDQVQFIPAKIPPHKQNDYIISHHHRLRMVELAVANNPKFIASDIEIKREGVTYTVDTLVALKKRYPKAKLNFIVGADTLLQLQTWRKYKKVLGLCRFLVYNRFGHLNEKELKKAKKKHEEEGGEIRLINGPIVQISSTDIRQAIQDGRSIRYMVTEPVQEYIEETEIYSKQPCKLPDIQSLKPRLQKTLTKSRYEHSINVSQCAVKLALIYHVDVEKAEIAGLLHDCAKCYCNLKKRKLAKKYGMIDKLYAKRPDLAHAEIGAMIAKKEYGIKDKEILSAIQKHTTGDVKMSKLDEIIYLADMIEINRNFKGVNRLRQLAQSNLHQATLAAMKQTVKHLKTQGGDIHPRTMLAYESLKKKHQMSEGNN